jgi:AraC family transcriptional regulator, L-rhamnose operon transcriptional activator RhaR
VHLYSEHVILRQRDVVAAAEQWDHDTPQRQHVHEFMEVVVVIGGTAVHRTRSGQSRINTGAVLLVRPGQWHAYDDPRDLRIWNVYIPTQTLEGELAALRSHPVLAGFTSARVTSSASSGTAGSRSSSRDLLEYRNTSTVDLKALEPYLADLAQPSLGTGRSLARLGQLLVVLDMLAPAFAFPKPGQSPPATHPAVIAATEELDAAPEYAWTLADLAERVHVSPSYLCRLFMRELGISPLHYLERRRLELTAQLLLEGDLSINEIGATAGWTDTNYMARRFRSAQGMSPSRYRAVFQRRSRHAGVMLQDQEERDVAGPGLERPAPVH